MDKYNNLLAAYEKSKQELTDYMIEQIKSHDNVVVDDCFASDKNDTYRAVWINGDVDFDEIQSAFLSLKNTGRLPDLSTLK
jgi:hypothetical protein